MLKIHINVKWRDYLITQQWRHLGEAPPLINTNSPVYKSTQIERTVIGFLYVSRF